MQKYITHRENLCMHSDAFMPNEAQRVVYIASDVDARIAEHVKDWESAAVERVQHLKRIAELELALKLVACQDEGCGGNLTPVEIYRSMQRIARAALGKGEG